MNYQHALPAGVLLVFGLTCAFAQSGQAPGFRSRGVRVPAAVREGFTSLSPDQTGVRFTNYLSNRAVAENQIRLVGSGVALGDIDGDGRCDIYLCRLEGSNALFRNLGGWKFEEITVRAGVACTNQYSTGCLLTDLDGDADLDLLVNGLGVGTRLFLNDGQGHFTESLDSGLTRRFGSTSLALADVDGDGDLDLYVANYRTTTVRSTGMKVLKVDGRQVVRPEDREQYEFTRDGLLLEHGEVDQLYLNDGKGHFAAVPWNRGAFLDATGEPLKAGPKDWGLSVQFRDMNGDGLPDLYVCNDFWSADRIWWNESRQGQVRFRAAPPLALRHTSTFSMGVDFADINRDGLEDFLVLDMLSRDHPRRLRQRSSMGELGSEPAAIEGRPQIERNTLFLNRGDGTYAEIAELAGVQASEWSWGVVFLDVDLDGYEDLLITTGHGFDTQDADTETRLAALGPVGGEAVGARVLEFPPLQVPNCAFRNRGDLTFEECGGRWGFAQAGVSHGIALADLDDDGDLDVVVNNLNAAAGIFRNEAVAGRVLVRLQGRPPNTQGIGARIRLQGGPVSQSQEMIAGGRYLSGDEAARMFATGKASNGLRLEVVWRNGTRSLVADVQSNRVYVIDQRGALPGPGAAETPKRAPFFTEARTITHTHVDELFDDFARQPLLPRRYSQLGPGVSWIDIDQDGREDLVIGSGRGGSLSIFRNGGEGRFEMMRAGGALGKPPDDQTTIVGWSPAAGRLELLVGQANYETAATNIPGVHRFAIVAGRMQPGEPLDSPGCSPGPLALGDVDGDGDLDLFVGGRLQAGRYPEVVGSRWYRNDGGRLVAGQDWPGLGLVSGASFSDLTGDGLPELILATEWGPLLLFRNRGGRLEKWDAPIELAAGFSTNSPAGGAGAWSLDRLRGWWNGVATGDFDEDGRLDIVASNWGENTPYQDYLADGWRLYFGDLAGHGTVDLVEAFQDRHYDRVVPWRDLDTLSQAMPWVREKFPSNAAYSEATIELLLRERFGQARELRVNWLASALFLNRGEHFVVRPLPIPAQFAPAFGVCVADYDGDGHEDIFLAQNFFAGRPQDSRYDAGRGLWLRGDGRGGFTALGVQESGIAVDGEQRGAALCDYDADGRIDLAVSQNRASLRLYHNQRAKPGLRVRLRGPEGNLSGIGGAIRWETDSGIGPIREVQAGSGYWSQNSAVQVLAVPAVPAKLSVRWPGGRKTLSTLPAGAKEIVIDVEGKVGR